MEWIILPTAIFAFFFGVALLFHGFPDIHIGKKEVHKHYGKDDPPKTIK